MPTKYFFVALLMFVLVSGCALEDKPVSNVTVAPPYWQSHNDRTQSQLDELRAFHERESTAMTENMYIFRNHEMERLAATGEELETENRRQANQENKPAPAQKWTFWFSKNKNKDDKDSTPAVSRTGGEVQNMR